LFRLSASNLRHNYEYAIIAKIYGLIDFVVLIQWHSNLDKTNHITGSDFQELILRRLLRTVHKRHQQSRVGDCPVQTKRKGSNLQMWTSEHFVINKVQTIFRKL